MSATMTDLKEDMRKDPDDLKREADRARDALENTLSELEQRLSPSAMVDRVMAAVKENGGEFGTNLLSQVRNNPVPTILSSVGLAWLMAASKSPPARAGDGSSFGEPSNAYQTAAEATANAADRVVDTTRQTADRVLSASRSGVQGVAECYSYLRTEQPLVLGAIAIVAGAALGALLPATSAENEWLGDASAAAKERIKGEARRRMGDVEEGDAHVAEAARQSPGEGADAREEQRSSG